MIKSNTQIKFETAKGICELSLETALLENRRIFISDTIDMNTANDFARLMMYLDSEDNKDINLYINSTGGEVMAGLIIYDIIQAARNTVNIFCVGQAYSMAAVLLACGKKGHRYILPHSKVMIHEPLISSGPGGSATSIKNLSDSIMETKKLLVDLLVKHSNATRRKVESAIKYDNFMTPEEAIHFGLCDKIVYCLY